MFHLNLEVHKRRTAQEADLANRAESDGPAIDDRDFTIGGLFFPPFSGKLDAWGATGEDKVDVILNNTGNLYLHGLNLSGSSGRVRNEMLQPIADRDLILQRQEVMSRFVENADLDELEQLCDDARRLADGVRAIFGRRELDEDSMGFGQKYAVWSSLLEGERTVDVIEGGWSRQSRQVDLHAELDQAVADIATGTEALGVLADKLHGLDDELLGPTRDNLKKVYEAAIGIDTESVRTYLAPIGVEEDMEEEDELALYDAFAERSNPFMSLPDYGAQNTRYYYEEEDGTTEFAWAASFDERLEDIASIVANAKKYVQEGYAKVTFDLDEPEEYVAGWNPLRPTTNQVRNDSFGDEHGAAFGGANGSGKTFTAIDGELGRHAKAQTDGYAPVESGNFHIYDSMASLGRVDSSRNILRGGVNGRGAFIKSMSGVGDMFDRAGQKPLIVMDEVGSETTPQAQTDVVMGIMDAVGELGGKTVLATHNELAIEEIERERPDAVHHLDYDVDPKTGQLERHFTVQPGSRDSEFIALARAMDMPSTMLGAMDHQLAGGQFVLPDIQSQPTLPSIEVYSEAERQALKEQPGGIGYMFPKKANNPLLVLLSESSDLQRTMFDHSASNMIVNSPPLKPQDVLERQRTFDGLASSGIYERVSELAGDLGSLEVSAQLLHGKSSKGLVRAMNPVLKALYTEDIDTVDTDNVEFTSYGDFDAEDSLSWLRLCQEAYPDDDRIERIAELEQVVALQISERARAGQLEEEEKRLSTRSMELYIEKRGLEDRLGNDDEFTKDAIKAYDDAHEESAAASRQHKALTEEIKERQKQIADVLLAEDKVLIASGGLELADEMNLLATDASRELMGQLAARDSDPGDKQKTAARKQFALVTGFPDAVAKSALEILDADQTLAELRQLTDEADSVHMTQALRVIEDGYILIRSAVRGAIDEYGLSNDVSSNVMPGSVARDTPTFNSSLSPLSREPSEEKLLMGSMLYSDDKKSPYALELEHLATLADTARRFASVGYAAVEFNDTGEITFEGLHGGGRTASPVDISLGINPGQQQIVETTGDHGSGKTFLGERLVTPAVMEGLTTGLTTAERATMPFLDRVVYFDRVVPAPGEDLSAGMKEIQYLTEVHRSLQTDGMVLGVADEIGSPTSAKYQEPLTLAVASEFAAAGSPLIMAVHNTDAAETLAASSDRVGAYHFDIIQLPDHSMSDQPGQGFMNQMIPGITTPDITLAIDEAKMPDALADAIRNRIAQ